MITGNLGPGYWSLGFRVKLSKHLYSTRYPGMGNVVSLWRPFSIKDIPRWVVTKMFGLGFKGYLNIRIKRMVP